MEDELGVRRVRPLSVPLPLSFAFPFPPECSGCGVRGVAVCVEQVDSEDIDSEGETEREEDADD